jgi:hypothetical protein
MEKLLTILEKMIFERRLEESTLNHLKYSKMIARCADFQEESSALRDSGGLSGILSLAEKYGACTAGLGVWLAL